MSKRYPVLAVLILLVLALVLAACGGDDEKKKEPTTVPSPVATEAAAATEAVPAATEAMTTTEAAPAATEALATEAGMAATEMAPLATEAGMAATESAMAATEPMAVAMASEEAPLATEAGMAATEMAPMATEAGMAATEMVPMATESVMAATEAAAVAMASEVPTEAPMATEALMATEAVMAATEAAAVGTEAAPLATEAVSPAATEAVMAPPFTLTEKFRVAVVMPSTTNDLAFSQSMYDALTNIQTALGGPDMFEFSFSENMFNVDDAATAIRDYASQGYNLVIAHGSQYGSSLQEIAPDFPDTAFAWGTTVDTFADQGINNVYAYEARSEQGGYVLGVMGAMLTKSNSIGIIGPIETGDAKLYVDGFKAGVTATNPDAKIAVNYIQSFSDLSLAAAAAETMLADGADVLTGTAQMVPGAVNKAKEAGALWFGTQSNQTSLAPDIVVASQVYKWEVVLYPIIQNILNGQMGGQSYALTLENGGLVIEYNPDFNLPDDVRAAADQATQQIISGEITDEMMGAGAAAAATEAAPAGTEAAPMGTEAAPMGTEAAPAATEASQ